MARTIRGGKLETRTRRLALPPSGEPYWVATAREGLSLGYRRLNNKGGTWVARLYAGQRGIYSRKTFAVADDFAEADGGEVLSYRQAMLKVSGEAPPVTRSSAYSVTQAVTDYLEWSKRERKAYADAHSRLTQYVAKYFGTRPLGSLTAADLDKWQQWAFTHDPRHDRTRASGGNAEQLRKRKSTVNKLIGLTLACFNRAWQLGHVERKDAWARVRRYKGAESARISRLSAAEARRLINASPADFRTLVQVALLTGARYGELRAFKARDFNSDAKTLLVAVSKSGKPRQIPLTDEAVALLEGLTAGRAPDDPILVRADGKGWLPDDQFKRMRAACTAAKIKPPINFHALRHSTASLLVEAGVPLAFVAELLGHSDSRMVSRHYQHLAPSVVHDALRAAMPSFGAPPDTSVRQLRVRS
jgi:integrase